MKIPGQALVHNLAHLLRWSPSETQTSFSEQQAIRHYSSGRKRALEIGVFEGASTRLIAENLHPDGEMYAVDPFFGGRVGFCWSEFIARREISRSSAHAKVKLVRALSHVAAQAIKGQFDFIFIDGDHSWEGIKKDWEVWAPRILPGGMLLLHDTQVPNYNPSVRNLGSYKYFQNEIQYDRRFSTVEVVDSLSVIQRVSF